MKIQPLYIFILSFVVGISFYSLFKIGLSFLIFLLILSAITFLFYFFCKKYSIFLVSLILFAIAIGMFWFYIVDSKTNSEFLDIYKEQIISTQGIIIDEPDEREKNTRLTIKINSVFGEDISEKINILVVADRHPEFEYGDKVKIEGKLTKPENFINDNGKAFDYISYLSKDDIFYIIYYPKITLESKNNGNFIKTRLFKIKQLFLTKISELIPDPHVSLLGGLIVGAKQSLGEDLQDDFRKTGIIHIVVLSGYNVTIVAEAIMRFFSFLPNITSIFFGAISIMLFAIITGGAATIIRASIMALLVLLARATGRTYQVTRGLFIAVFFMVLQNPKIVIFDPSFQLSFLATLGLIYLSPLIEKYFHLVPTKFQLREFATATISTQLFVLPLLLYTMGELSLVALPVNLLILLFIPITMLFGFLTGVVGMISSIIAFPFASISYLLLSYELSVVEIFAKLPFASISIETFPLWLMLGFYIFYALLIMKFQSRIRTNN